MIRDSLSSAVWWSSYEITKYFLHDHNPRSIFGFHPRKVPEFYQSGVENEDPIIQMASAVVAAVASTIVQNPIDVVKTRLQTQDLTNQHMASHFRSTLTLSLDLFRKEGFRVYMKGLTPTLVVSIPHSIVGVLIYEYAKKFCLKVPE